MATLTFDSSKAMYDGDRDIVRFWAADDAKRIPCAVSFEALTDYTRIKNAGGADLVPLYQANADKIHAVVQCKYDTGAFGADGVLLVRSADLI